MQKSDEVIKVCKTSMSLVWYIGVKRHHQLCGFHKTIGTTILSESAPIVRAVGIIFVLRSVDPVGLELQKEGSWVYNFTQQLVLSASFQTLKDRIPKKSEKEDCWKTYSVSWKKKHHCSAGITLNCQPQNCQLVGNPEVGNFEYIHYSELPTLLLLLVYLMILKATATTTNYCTSMWGKLLKMLDYHASTSILYTDETPTRG